MRKILYLMAGVLLGLAIADLALYRRMRDAELAANDAASSLDACRTIASKIAHRRGVKKSDTVDTEVTDMTSYVERTAKGVGLAADAIVFIEPGAPRAIDGTPLTEQSIHLELERSPLEKLGAFLRALESNAPSVRVIGVRMIEPRDLGPTELWNCEVNLTQTTMSGIRP